MAHREKLAWLSLGALALTFVPYFVLVAAKPPAGDGPAGAGPLAPLALILGVQAVIQLAGRVVLARRSPEDAQAPMDERDRGIEHRAMTSAYYVLVVGVVLVGCVMPFSHGGWDIVNAALLAIALAELTHYGMVVTGYRRA